MLHAKGEDWGRMEPQQRIGYALVRGLGWLQARITERLIGEPVWRSSDGTCTPLSKMSNQHLHNAIRKLARDGEQGDWLVKLRCELVRRRMQEERDARSS